MTGRARALLSGVACAALAAAAWLFLPRAAGDGAPALRLALVDVSASAARAEEWLPWVRGALTREAEGARAAGQELAVAAYARGVVTAFAPGAPAELLRRLEARAGAPFDPRAGLVGAGDDGASELAAALALVEPLLLDGSRPRGELVLLGEPAYTGASPAGALARLARAGLAPRVIVPPRARGGDLGVTELRLAPRVELGAPVVAVAHVVWRPGREPSGGALAVEVENGGTTRAFERALALGEEEADLELPLDCGPAGPGRTLVRVTARPSAGADAWPENDRASATTAAAGARVVAVLAPADELDRARAWLAVPMPGLELVFAPLEQHVPLLAEVNALVTLDAAPGDLAAPLLQDFVERGGGWLALAGWRFLAGWRTETSYDSPFDLLPLEPSAEEAGARDVLLLVDGSGSMEGAPFEAVRAAALELAAAAPPEDRVALRFFTSGLEPEHALRERGPADPEAARRAARELLALRVPSGTTHLLSSLEELARDLGRSSDGPETLVLLLTDGRERDPAGDAAARAAAVVAALGRARARLVVIAVGDAEFGLLSALAGNADELRHARALGDLRELFLRELFRGRLVQGAIELRRSASGGLANEVDGGVALALAPLERHLRAELRPFAEVLWESAEGAPVLALQRLGLGRVAQFTSAPVGGWGERLRAVDFAPLLAWLARSRPPELGIVAHLAGGELAVEGLDETWPASVAARLCAARGLAERARLELLPPSRLGRDPTRWREGPCALPAGDEELVAYLAAPEGGDAERAVPVQRTLADEFARREAPLVVPAVPEGALLEPRSAAPRRASPAAPWVLALGLGLLFLAGLARTERQGIPGNDR